MTDESNPISDKKANIIFWVLLIPIVWLFLEYQTNKWVERDCRPGDGRCQCFNTELMKEFNVIDFPSVILMSKKVQGRISNASRKCPT